MENINTALNCILIFSIWIDIWMNYRSYKAFKQAEKVVDDYQKMMTDILKCEDGLMDLMQTYDKKTTARANFLWECILYMAKNR